MATIDLRNENQGREINAGNEDDIIIGSRYTDILRGWGGDDTIEGGKGDDHIATGTGNNTLVFNNGDGKDYIYSTGGNDTLKFNGIANFNDLALAQSGNNLIVGYPGGQVILLDYFAAAPANYSVKNVVVGDVNKSLDDFINEYLTAHGAYAQLVSGYGVNGSDADEVFIAEGISEINAGAGNDTIYGSDQVDVLRGQAGNDTIYASAGDDHIDGGDGNDTVIYNSNNFGNDTLYPHDGENLTIDMSALGFNENDIQYSYSGDFLVISTPQGSVKLYNCANLDATGNNGSLLLKLSNEAPAIDLRTKVYDITVAGNYDGTWHNERIDARSAGGTVVINAGAGDDTIYGSNSVDVLRGQEGDDTIVAGKGDDHIDGGLGNNTIVFNNGDGKDYIYSTGGNDTLKFNDAANAGDLYFARSGNNLIIGYPGNGKVVALDYFVNQVNSVQNVIIGNNAPVALEDLINDYITEHGALAQLVSGYGINGTDADEVFIAEGISEINAGAGNDTIYGSDQVDVLRGQAGNDTIYASAGDDHIDGGDGNDTVIYNSNNFGNDTLYPHDGENLTIDMSALGFNENDIQYSYSGDFLVISTPQGSVKLYNCANLDATGNNGSLLLKLSNEAPAIDLRTKVYDITVAGNYDGTWHNERIDARSAGGTVVINAGAGDDTIYGSNSVDVLRGQEGDDTIVAGKGDDHIDGGLGNNTIVFNNGDGKDFIYSTGGNDTLKFNDAANAGDLYFARSGNNLIIGYPGNGKVVALDYFVNQVNSVQNVIIGNNAPVALEDLINDYITEHGALAQLVSGYGVNGTDADEVFIAEGISEINAGAGNDTIYGSDQVDVLRGQAGNDTIYASAGDDHIDGGDGNDTVIYNSNNFGNDTLYPHDGENLTIDMSALGFNENDIQYSYSGDFLVISTPQGSVKLYNCANLDATGNNGSLLLKLSNEAPAIDLRTKIYDITVAGNYDGTWHNERIDARSAGGTVVINAGAGDDTIYGSNSVDVLRGQEGDDTIVAGKGDDHIDGGLGNNTIVFNNGDGKDFIYSTGGNDTLKFNDVDNFNDFVLSRNNNDDLVISYPGNGEVVLLGYFVNQVNSVKNVIFGNQNKTIEEFIADYETIHGVIAKRVSGYAEGTPNDEVFLAESGSEINAGAGNDTLYGSDQVDVLRGQAGNDTIYASAGDDHIDGGDGNDTVIYNSDNFGNDTLYPHDGENLTIDMSALGFNENDIQYSYSGNFLVISTPQGSVKLYNCANLDATGNNGSLLLKLSNEAPAIDLRTKVYDITVAGNYDGTWHNEKIDARSAGGTVVINGGAGDDTIYGSNYLDILRGNEGDDVINPGLGDDHIAGGSGSTTINVSLDNGHFGNKTLYLTQDDNEELRETLNVHLTGNVSEELTETHEVVGNNLVITVRDGNTEKGKFTIVDFANLDKNKIGDLKLFKPDDTVLKNLKDINESTHIYNPGEVYDYDGTALNDTIDARNAGGTVVINGGTGDDTIYGSDYLDILRGNEGNDTIVGGLGDDHIDGGSGNNDITPGKGNDTIYTQDGNNNIHIKDDDDTDTIYSGTGTNTIVFDDIATQNDLKAAITLASDVQNLVIKYSDNGILKLKDYNYRNQPENDFILQTADGNTINLFDFITEYLQENGAINITGEGTIYGTEGDDTIIGSERDDDIYTGSGNDTVYAGGGNDTVHAEQGTNLIYGGDGNDTIYGGENNEIHGGAGNDVIYAGSGYNATIYGEEGNDVIVMQNTNSGTVELKSNCGNDTIYCSTLLNIKFADVENLDALANQISIMNANDGTNDYLINYGNNQIRLKDVNQFGLKFKTQDGTQEVTLNEWLEDHPILNIISGQSGIIYGTNQNDIIYGSNSGDSIYAQGGDDIIRGGAGNDYIMAGDGNDTINAGGGYNTLDFGENGSSRYDDVVEHSGGVDTLRVIGALKNMARRNNDLVITYGNNYSTITVKDYYLYGDNHSTKYIATADGQIMTIQQAIESLNAGIIETDSYIIRKSGNLAKVQFAQAGVTGEAYQTNYLYADDGGSTLQAGESGINYLIGGRGNDVLIGGTGVDYFAGGAGQNAIYVTQGGGQDKLSVSQADEDNIIAFNNIQFNVDEYGKVTGLGNLIITDMQNGYQSDNVYIKGYGSDYDYLTADNYFYKGDVPYYYDGYTLQDASGHRILLTDAVKMAINREADTDWTVGNLHGNSTNETFYVNSTDEAVLQEYGRDSMNGSVDAGAGNDTIYSGGIYQRENGGTLHPHILAGEGNDEIHAEGNKIYFTTSRTDLQYSPTNLIASSSTQTNNGTTITTVYNTDHIYITPDKKVMTGYFFFAYQFGKDDSGDTTVESIMLDESDKYEYIGTYHYEDAGMDVHVYHTDKLENCKIEGKKTYFFDYGDKVASGQVDVYGAEGDDTIYIGNGSTAYGGEGNDTIIGDGIAYGGEGNDKIFFNNNNFYMDGLGFTYYYADGGEGNDYVDMSEVITREHETVELSSQSVEYENEYDTQFMFSEGINTLVINPEADKNIIINMSQFAWDEQNRHERWYDHGHKNSDVAFGSFKRGDDLYISMTNGEAKTGTLIIKDYFAYKKDEHGEILKNEFDEPIRVYSDERRANLNIYFYSTIRDSSDYFFPESYMTVDEFIQHYDDWNNATDTDDDGHKDTLENGGEFDAFYSHRINEVNSGTGYVGRWTKDANNYFTFIDNQEAGNIVINSDRITPEFYEHGTKSVVENPNYPNIVTHETINVYHNAGYYIIGGDGQQTIYGGDGDDVIYGDNIGHHDENGNWVEAQNGGNDRIYAGAGDDYVVGGDGDDLIDGGDGQNVIYGGKGRDTLVAGNPVNTTISQYGDVYRGGVSYAYGEEGDDTIYSQAVFGPDGTINVEESKAYLAGEYDEGYQYLYGGDGDDTIIANSFKQRVYAGAGDDKVEFYNNNNSQMEIWHFDYNENQIYLGEGDDKFFAYGNGGYAVSADSGNNIIDARGSSAVAFIQGGTGYDTIYGGSGREQINTGLGDSIVYAGGGDDVIYSGTNEYYSSYDIHKSDEIHGGEGNDTIEAFGKSKVYGDEGDDIISLDGGRSNVPSALTIDGGTGDDIYRGYGTSGVNTLIASEGNDTIQFLGVQAKAFRILKNGNDIIIETTNGNNTGLTVLKDYYDLNQKALFDNWTVETYTDDIRGPKRGTFTMPEFIEYAIGNNIIMSGYGTDFNDYIEAPDGILSIDGRGGNDNIIAGQNAEIIKGGAGDDYILGSNSFNPQIILGDSGNATIAETSVNGYTAYKANYTPAADTSGDGNDNIVSYADNSFIFGEGGNDTITVNGQYAHVWGGEGNDVINTALYNGVNHSFANEIHGKGGDDYIKARAGFIDGGAGNDTIIQKAFGGNYATNLQILKDKYGATDAWISKLAWDTESNISSKSQLVSREYAKIETIQNNIRDYEYSIKTCEANDWDYYGNTTLEEYRRKLANAKASYNGLSQTYAELELAVTEARNADITAGNNDSLNGTKGTKDIYIDKMLSTTSTQEEKATAKAAYEHDQLVVKTYKEFVDKYDDLTYNGWDYTTGNYYANFRNEGDKEYWQNKLNEAELALDGVTGTQTAFDNLHATNAYTSYNIIQTKLNNYQDYLNALNNGEEYSGPTFTDYSKDSWFNKADLLKDNIMGCVGTKNVYEKINTYVNNYDEVSEHDLAYFEGKLATAQEHKDNYYDYDMTYEEACAEYDTAKLLVDNYNEITSKTKTEWQEALTEATAAYRHDQYLYDLYSTYYEFYFDEEFNDPDYAQHTFDIKNDGVTSVYESFREEAEQNYSSYYDGSPKYYWSRMANLIYNRMNGNQGTQSVAEEMYMRYQAKQIPYSSYKYWQEQNERNIDEYNDYKAFYENYDNDEVSTNILERYDAYIGHYTKDNLEGYIPELQADIDGSGATYERLKAELDAMIADYKKNAPGLTDHDKEIALRIMTHSQDDIILGGAGDDTITIGHTDEGDDGSSSSVIAMGEEGNDTYIIEGGYNDSYNSYSSPRIEIYDTEGTNTIKFNEDTFNSGNIGMYANVELKKDSDGNFVKKANGDYDYTLKNFGPSSSNLAYSYANTPLYDGDAGYAIVFVDNGEFKESLNQFNYGGLANRDQSGVKFDADTLDHLDYIWSNDGKYITKAQIEAAMQNTANWLAQNGYDSFMNALDTASDHSQRPAVLNELRNFENLGSLEWITPTGENGTPTENDIIEPATAGLAGTDANDTLVINSAAVPTLDEYDNVTDLNNVIDLKLGNDKVTFEGEFGDYIIQSASTVDNAGVARQSDTISLAGYSVKDGTLKFSQVGSDLVLTAYSGENVVGTVTYKDFLNGEYTIRSFVLKADDHDYLVSKETATAHVADGSNITNVRIDDDDNSYYNIRFIESTDGNKVTIDTNGKRASYYLLGETPVTLGWVKDGEPVEIFSQGNTDDSYDQGLTADVNLTIHDAGGNNELIIANASWNNQNATVNDSKLRLFFDVDAEGNVSDTKHIIWTERFRPSEKITVNYNTQTIQYYDTDNLLKLLNNDPDHMEGVITFDGDLYRIQTDDRTDHSSWIVNTEDVDASIVTARYIRSITTDVVPWLQENHYESVNDALTKLKADIAAKQELMADLEVDSEDFNTYKNEITADNAKIDELMDFFNIGYGDALYTNLFGDEQDNTLTANSLTKRVEGDKGDDIIDVTYGSVNKSRKIVYSFDRGDGHDTLIKANQADGIYVKADKTMFTKLRADGWNLKIEFYSDNSSTENPEGSVTLQDYFKHEEDKRIDNFVIQSTGNADEELSIKELLTTNLINDNVFFSTKESDNFAGGTSDRVIYVGDSNYDTNDVIENSSGNDEIYISEDRAYTDITYTVGNGGDDIISGSFYATGLIVDYGDTHAQTEYRKIGDDMKMLFFMGDGDNKQKVGSITFKDYYAYGASEIGSANSEAYDRFIFRVGTGGNAIDTKVNSLNLLEDYRLLGGSLEDNGDVPYFSETVADNTQNSVITANDAQNTLVFNDVESFRDLSFAIAANGEDLVITHNGKTTTIEGYTKGNYNINYIRVGDLVKDINENKAIPNRDLAIPEFADPYTYITAADDAVEVYGTYDSDYITIPASAENVNKIYTKADGNSNNDGGNDVVTGTVNNAEIKTFDRGDTIEITGHGNTITGGVGNDVFRITTDNNDTNVLNFDYSDGNDIIENTSGNVQIHMIHGYALTFEKFGDDLRIKYWDNNNALYIKEYFKENGCNKDANFSIKIQNGEAQSLATYIENYLENKGLAEIPDTAMTTITGSDYNDLIKIPENVANAITQIKTNSGNDTITGTIDNAVINGGYGDDTINITGSNNIIRGNRGNDVINITADNGQTNTVYFADGDGDSNSSYCGNDIIHAVGGNLKLKFCDQWLRDITLARKDNYLVVRYNNDNNLIFIQDYFSNNDKNPAIANITLVSGKNNEEISLDNFITQNYSSTTGLYEVWGTDGDDKFIHQLNADRSVTYNLGKGNDTLEFVNISGNNKDNITRKAVVNSEGESDNRHNVLNKDTITMGGYHDGNVGYQNRYSYGFGENGAITISTVDDKTYNGHKRVETQVTYNNFLNRDADGNWMTADLQVQNFADTEYPYQIKRYDSVQHIDTQNSFMDSYGNYTENVGAIYIKASEGASYITDGHTSETDWILTDGGASLYYASRSRGDVILTNSAFSNDIYSVCGGSTSGGTTYIVDKGGSDTLNLINVEYDAEMDALYPTSGYNGLKRLYLAFNVDKYGNTDNTFVIRRDTGNSNHIWPVATDYLSGKYDYNSIYDSIIIDAARSDGRNTGIEAVTAYAWAPTGQRDENGYDIYGDQKIADINLEGWYSQIKQDVVNWLNTNGYDSTADVFALDTSNNDNYQTVQSLIGEYDKYTANDYRIM